MDWETDFYQFLMDLICKQGSIRLQMASNDIVTAMQKLPPKHPVNMHRKQYGNLQQCFKAKKQPFFTYTDNLVILLPKNKMDQLHQQGLVPLYQLYVATNEAVEKKLIDIMRINRENKCAICGDVYKVIINRNGMCGEEEHQKAHVPIEKNKKKLQKFLINNDIQVNKDTLEAVVKIKMDPKVDQYLPKIQSKIEYLKKQLESLSQFRGLNYDLKSKQKIKYKQQLDELQRVEEICRRADKFSDQLKSLFYVCVHYHYLQNTFRQEEIKLEEIVEIFQMIFFNMQTTTVKHQKVFQFCLQHYKILINQKHHKNQSFEIPNENKNRENKSPTRSPTPQKLNNTSIVELSTPQLKNYYNKMLKHAAAKICTEPSQPRSKSPMKQVFKI